MNRVFRLFLPLALCIGAVMMTAAPASAWNRDTHQRITELAYATLKAYSMCGETAVADSLQYEMVFNACREDVNDRYEQAVGEGPFYSCSCVEQMCASRCSNSQWSEYQTSLCVDHCATSVSRTSGETCSSTDDCASSEACEGDECGCEMCESGYCSGPCDGPHYWSGDPTTNKLITADFCHQLAYEATHVGGSEECRQMVSWLVPAGISPSDAKRTVQYFQGFESTACPARDTFAYDNLGGQNPPCKRPEMIDSDKAQPLIDWKIAPQAAGLVGPGAPQEVEEYRRDYLPATGEILGKTVWRNPQVSDAGVDFTGTIIGYHSGAVDLLHDFYTRMAYVPILDDALTTAKQIAVGAGVGVIAAATGVGAVIVCGLVCVGDLIGIGDCGDCFNGAWDAIEDMLEEGAKVIEEIEDINMFSSHVSTTSMGARNTSMFHFMRYSDGFDDFDGYYVGGAFGFWKSAGAAMLEGWWLDQLIDIRAVYKDSKRPLMNYQIENPDDSMLSSSPNRNMFYWERSGLTNYVMPPVDNLAYYWWHKWFQGRLSGQAEVVKVNSYGLLPIGAVLHATQDINQPHHTVGVTEPGHVDYERHVSRKFDAALATFNDRDTNQVLVNFADPAQEEQFLRNVSDYVKRIYVEVAGPAGQTSAGLPEYQPVHIREMMHWLHRDTGIEQAAFEDLEESEGDAFTANSAIPRAVAASLVVLHEAASEPRRYAQELDLTLASFEHQGPVPPLSEETSGLVTMSLEAPNGYEHSDPAWACASQTSRGEQAVEEFFTNQLSGRRYLSIAFAERLRCELQLQGLPVPPNSTLDEMGQEEAKRLEIRLRLMADGNLVQFETDMACLQANSTRALPVGVRNMAQERCDGLLDSDADGILDQDDQCLTPEDLLQKGYTVDARGCVFQHNDVFLPGVNPYVPGAIRRKR